MRLSVDATDAPRPLFHVRRCSSIFGSAQGKLIALDAKTGGPAKGFGVDGVVETKTPEIMNGLPNAYYSYSSPPGIYKNLAIFGSRVQ